MKMASSRKLKIIGCWMVLCSIVLLYGGCLEGEAVDGFFSSKAVESGSVSVSAGLVQEKVYAGGDGRVELALTLKANEVKNRVAKDAGHHLDMVIVLDRSGSMQGEKMAHARRAVINLLSLLTPSDRFGLVSYSNDVCIHSGMTPVSCSARRRLESMLRGIRAGGGTNLGAGLQSGIRALASASRGGHPGRIILISDGLANQGITDPLALSQMAFAAAGQEFSVSTVGVGNDFNERLMTSLADYGTGTYYYLENPAAFAGVFERELQRAQAVAAARVTVELYLPSGVILEDAAGYPIEMEGRVARFRTGDLVAGQTRRLFLKLRVPTRENQVYRFRKLGVTYQHDGRTCRVENSKTLQVSCVNDSEEVMASVNKTHWTQKVLQSDYNRLREDVAADIREGDQQQAMDRIDRYRKEKETVNAQIGSPEVADNLARDVGALRRVVEETFCGAPAAVTTRQKKNAKVLQYEAYKGKRQDSAGALNKTQGKIH